MAKNRREIFVKDKETAAEFIDKLVGGAHTPRYGGQYSNVGEALRDTRTNINYQANPSVTLKGTFGRRGNYIGAELNVYNLIDKLMKKKGK
tara:strand:+ start:587 stop:859 length:273 start_codon:yes stop_codon:yes gene_type:complete